MLFLGFLSQLVQFDFYTNWGLLPRSSPRHSGRSLPLTTLINKCSTNLSKINLVGPLSCSPSEMSLACINSKNVLTIQSHCNYNSLPLLCFSRQYRQIAQLWCGWYGSSFSVTSENLFHLNPLNPGEKYTGVFRNGHLLIMCIISVNDYFKVY